MTLSTIKGIYPLLTLCMVMTAGCSNKKSTSENINETKEEAGMTIATDSLFLSDSLIIGDSKATTKITGLYPADIDSRVADSVRLWIGDRLSHAIGTTAPSLFEPTKTLVANGDSLIAVANDSILADTRRDFEQFRTDGITTSYEYDFSFRPIYTTDKVLTYSFSGYVYLGGAHGGATGAGQTFVKESGVGLNGNNMFMPSRLDELTAMLRQGLWEQYFKQDMEGDSATLRDALLINPDTLHLPVFPPLFLEDGINFTYQQYEIACYAAGMPSCTISYDSIRPLLTPEVAKLIPVSGR